MSKGQELQIHPHTIYPDWCHICGKRSNATSEIWGINSPHVDYLRICLDCADAIGQAARKGAEHRDQGKQHE